MVIRLETYNINIQYIIKYDEIRSKIITTKLYSKQFVFN